jgi:formylglycine-generating enzyme required for sulfatase activity
MTGSRVLLAGLASLGLAGPLQGCGGDSSPGDAEAGAEGGGDADAGSCPPGMVLVPAGPFVMGSDPGEGGTDEEPEHVVRLSAYCIDVTEVTAADYRACVAAAGCVAPSCEYRPDDHPVVCVDWSRAAAYCAWAGKRLPTEAEWEKAARGGCELAAPAACGIEDERTYPWGDAPPSCALANGEGCGGNTDAVGSRPAGDSAYGAHDMSGNAWEWVADWYDAGYYATCASGCSDPAGPGSGADRVLRGGSWLYGGASDVRAAYRFWLDPTTALNDLGLRCARGP